MISAVCPFGIIGAILLLPFVIILIPVFMALQVFGFFITTFGTPIGLLLFSTLIFAIMSAVYKLAMFIKGKRQNVCLDQNDKIFNEYILRR